MPLAVRSDERQLYSKPNPELSFIVSGSLKALDPVQTWCPARYSGTEMHVVQTPVP